MAIPYETIDDIYNIMRHNRDYYRGYMGITNPMTDSLVANLLDRVKTAHEREIESLKRILNQSQTALAAEQHNVAKLKSALLYFYKNTCGHCDLHDACQEGEDGMSVPCNMILKAKDALEASGENISAIADWTAIDTEEETMSNQEERC